MLSLALPAMSLSACGSAGDAKTTSRRVEQRPRTTGAQRRRHNHRHGRSRRRACAEVSRYAAKAVSSSEQPWNYQVARKVAALGRPMGIESDFSQKELEQIEGRKENERVFVQLVTTPDGPRVSDVTYNGTRPIATAASNRADMIRKYGAPSVDYHERAVVFERRSQLRHHDDGVAVYPIQGRPRQPADRAERR